MDSTLVLTFHRLRLGARIELIRANVADSDFAGSQKAGQSTTGFPGAHTLSALSRLPATVVQPERS